MAVADLGGLGAEEGAGTRYTVAFPSVLPPLLPWLLVLLLFLPKANRCASAWWVLVPLGLVAGGCGLAELIGEFSTTSVTGVFLEVVTILTFGLTVTWQLAPYLRRSRRWLTFLLTLPTLAGASAVVFLLRQGSDLKEGQQAALGLVALASTVILSLALWWTGLACRRRYSRSRCFVWLFIWVVVSWVLLITPFFVIAMVQHGGGPSLFEFLLSVLGMTGVSVGTLLPFLGLSWWNGFYGERFRRLLHVEAVAPPVIAAGPITGTMVRDNEGNGTLAP